MENASTEATPPLPGESVVLDGLAASGGRYEGGACVVRGPEDFALLREGDVLVAPFTTPAYNVVLPLLGAVVTDKGGVLSHAAIVAREYGLPAVVATGIGTSAIESGALVRVDADAGRVVVLSPSPAAAR